MRGSCTSTSVPRYLINRGVLLKSFCWYGLGASIISSIAFFMAYAWQGHYFPNLSAAGFDYRQATTVTLAIIIACQIANVLNIRYQIGTMFTKKFFHNSMIFIGIIMEIVLLIRISYSPILSKIFGTAGLNQNAWVLFVAVPLPLILIDEGRRWLLRKSKGGANKFS